MILGRDSEKTALAELVAAAGAGRGRALLLHGVAGSGKTTLLDHAASLAGDGATVLRATGVPIEADLPYAALHMLLRPALDGVDALPGPQASALRHAFGLAAEGGANRFTVGLATLSLLAERAEAGPVLCLVDDAQWLDLPSLHAMLFAARRFEADRVAMVLASRVSGGELGAAGLAQLEVAGLDHDAGIALLEHNGVSARWAQERLLAVTGGNPLALRELAHDADGLSGSAAVAVPLTTALQRLFAADVESLEPEVRDLLLIAAAEGTGDAEVILRAADGLGVDPGALRRAADTGQVAVTGDRVAFRHPLARAAVYQSAPPARRRAVHGVLSRIFDSEDDADRRAWHAAACVSGTDDEVAADLAAAADRAASRGGQAAAVAILERAAELSSRPDARGRHLVAAAEAAGDSGRHDRTRELAARAEPLVTDPLQASRLAELRAEEELLYGSVPAARDILTRGARSVAAVDAGRAVIMTTHLANAAIHWGAADWVADAVELLEGVGVTAAQTTPRHRAEGSGEGGTRTGAGSDPAHRAEGSGSRGEVASSELIEAAAAACSGIRDVLDGDARRGAGLVRGMVDPMRPLRSGMVGARVFAATLSALVADDEVTAELVEPIVAECRSQGMMGWLPTLHSELAPALLRLGRFRDARASASEGARIAVELGQTRMSACLESTRALLAAVAGEEPAEPPAELSPWATATWRHARALAALAQGGYDVAADHWASLADSAAVRTAAAWVWAPDQVEAAVRAGDRAAAQAARAVFARWAHGTGRGDLAAVLLRCDALLASEADAGQRFEAAIAAHETAWVTPGAARRGPVSRPFDAARTRLLYGEWLRRHRDRAAARRWLRQAAEEFERLGATAWARRARLELRATGETRTTRAATPDLRDRLTPQELQVVRLAATGATNRDIGAQLYLSPRTVGHHLYRAFPKLGVANRAELARLFAADST